MRNNNNEIISVFYNDVAIHLEDHLQEYEKNAVFIRSRSDLTRFLDRFFNSDSGEDIFLKAADLEELFKNYQSYFRFVEAAGGLVENKNKEFLLIKRFGIWDLPKGKLEKNENTEICALREVNEETGAGGLKIIGKLPVTYHIYFREGNYILKKTSWFRMFTEFSADLRPQTKEDISEAIWMKRPDAQQALSMSYRSIKDILLPCLSD